MTTHLTAIVYVISKNIALKMVGLLAEICWWKYYK